MFSAQDPDACDSTAASGRPVRIQASRSPLSLIRRLTPTLYTYVNKEDTEATDHSRESAKYTASGASTRIAAASAPSIAVSRRPDATAAATSAFGKNPTATPQTRSAIGGRNGHAAVATASSTPTAIAAVIACSHVIGRTTAWVDSSRARIADRHQICPAAGTCAS